MQTNNRVNEPDYQKVIKEPRQCRQCFFFLNQNCKRLHETVAAPDKSLAKIFPGSLHWNLFVQCTF